VRGLVEESFGTVTVTITTLESLDTALPHLRRAVASSAKVGSTVKVHD
jgi:hypothetical protein